MVGFTGHPQKFQEPLVELRQLTFAQLLRNLDEAEQCEHDDQHAHEHSSLLSGRPSRPCTGDDTDDLHDLVQGPAVAWAFAKNDRPEGQPSALRYPKTC
jgi:hypothetical protein